MKTQFITRYLDAGSGDGGGIANQPTLAELSDPNYVPKNAPTPEEIAAAKEAEDAKVAADQAAAEYEALVAEAKKEDGTLKDGYIEVDGKITKDPNYKPADDTPDEGDTDPLKFWADVDKLHGAPIEVEFPEGVDPLSPEGVYIRDKAVAEKAIEGFDTHLKTTLPRAYAYMLHIQAGGDDASFFSEKSINLPEYNVFKEDVTLQTNIYKSSLLGKGLDDETAQLAVDKAIKDGVLFNKADAAYKETETQHKATLDELEARNYAAEKEYTTSVNNLNQQLTTAITEGKGMKFIIPDTEKVDFTNFVRKHVEYDGKEKKFLLVQKIDGELDKQLEAMYLLYKKGDLKGLITRAAQTQTVQRLGARVAASRQQQSSVADDKPGGFVPLGSL
jgi:hypothetical protein